MSSSLIGCTIHFGLVLHRSKELRKLLLLSSGSSSSSSNSSFQLSATSNPPFYLSSILSPFNSLLLQFLFTFSIFRSFSFSFPSLQLFRLHQILLCSYLFYPFICTPLLFLFLSSFSSIHSPPLHTSLLYLIRQIFLFHLPSIFFLPQLITCCFFSTFFLSLLLFFSCNITSSFFLPSLYLFFPFYNFLLSTLPHLLCFELVEYISILNLRFASSIWSHAMT